MTFDYAGDGTRRLKFASSGDEIYRWDPLRGQMTLREFGANLQETFVHDPSDCSEAKSPKPGSGGCEATPRKGRLGGSVLAQIEGSSAATGTAEYALHDHLGSVREWRNAAGGQTWNREYTPYGDRLAGSTADERFMFTGHPWDAESQLYHAPSARIRPPWPAGPPATPWGWSMDQMCTHTFPFCHRTLSAEKPTTYGYPAAPQTLGEHVRKRRMDLGLSQQQLADRLGVNRGSVENWEYDNTVPHLRVLPKVIDFLGFDPRTPGVTIGERLKHKREQLGLRCEEIAEVFGVNPGTIHLWEAGRQTPSPDNQDVIERFLNQ